MDPPVKQELCPVCLHEQDAEVCMPCSNNHKYHQRCLLEWSKMLRTCPLCREEFTKVSVQRDGKHVRYLRVPTPSREQQEALNTPFDPPYANMACEICHQLTDEAQMLVCDECDLGYHMYCLNPPLNAIPRGRWLCVRCRPGPSGGQASSGRPRLRTELVQAVELPSDSTNSDEEAEGSDEEGTSEAEGSDESGTESDTPPAGAFSEDDDVLAEDPNLPSSSRNIMSMQEARELRKGRKTKKRKGPKRKRTVKRATGGPKVKRKVKRRRRKTKKRKAKKKVVQQASSSTLRTRIADVCGIDLEHSDRYSVVRRPAAGSSSYRSALARAHTEPLVLLGERWIPSPDADEPETPTSATSSSTQPTPSTSTVGLLDDIIANQTKILVPGRLLKVNRDGTLSETEAMQSYLKKRENKLQDKDKKAEPERRSSLPTEKPQGPSTSVNGSAIGVSSAERPSKMALSYAHGSKNGPSVNDALGNAPSPTKRTRWQPASAESPSLPPHSTSANTGAFAIPRPSSNGLLQHQQQALADAANLQQLLNNSLFPRNVLVGQNPSVSLASSLQSSVMASMAAAAGSKLPPTSMNLPAFNSNTLLELLSNSGGGLLPGLLPPPPQMPQLVSRNPGQFATGQFAPDLLALYQQQLNSGANMNLNNLLLPQTTQIPMPQVQSAPIPAPPPMRMNLSSMTEPLAPPPPPPPPMKLSKSKSGEGASNGRSSGRSSGSPMDIDLELDEATTSSKPSKGGTNGDKKERAAATNEAAKAMKAALRPHYSKGSVTKEEYKEIMKKGVSKLVKKLRAGKQLDQQKVDGFVRDYVNVFSTRRQLKNHKAQR